MPRVNHFEIHADDPERAAEFYKLAFGWTIKKWEGPVDFWLIVTGASPEPGINGGIKRRSESQATVNSIEVPSIDEYVRRVERCGGEIVMEKRPIPGFGWHCCCQDTEGNLFGLIETDVTVTGDDAKS